MSSTLSRSTVVVHPTVLLSAVDHYNRVAKGTRARVVGALLGSVTNDKIDVLNSFAVPFEEDEREDDIWFLDHNYMENMFAMFRKVNAKEQIIGWYSTGPKIRSCDEHIHRLFFNYTSNPVFVIIDVQPSDLEIPTEAYYMESRGTEEGEKVHFGHIPCVIGALEAEEIGVEHLLRDVKDVTISSLSTRLNDKLNSLQGLVKRLGDIKNYLMMVESGKIPLNQDIACLIQDIFNLLPQLQDNMNEEITRSTNDNAFNIYIASIIRTIVALHNLINNKIVVKINDAGGDAKKPEEPKKTEEKPTTADQKK